MQRVGAVLLTLALAGVVGCSSSADPEATLHVYAAASLQEPFEALAADFEEQHDGVDVQIVLTGSADAVAQIKEGAPADVVATADTTTMDRLLEADRIAATPRVFATNTLQLVVATDDTSSEKGWDAVTETDNLVVCAPVVPCGAATVTLAAQEGVELRPVSEEQSVTDVLAKVSSGSADRGIVYHTDVRRADGVRGVDLPGADRVVNEYPIAPVVDAQEADLAAEFVRLVLSDAGRERLDAAGFGAP